MVLSGCDKGDAEAEAEPAQSPSGRVNAVSSKSEPEKPPPKPSAFCDVYFSDDEAKSFEFPELEGGAPPAAKGWRWVNVWATWCKPCIEEMPRLVKWRKRLSDVGMSELVLVSVDESRETVESFREDHPKTPSSLLISEPKAIKPWVTDLGLDEGAPLPIHVFVDAANRTRCLRAGGVGENEYRAVKRLVSGS